jgi:hypothetical protein
MRQTHRMIFLLAVCMAAVVNVPDTEPSMRSAQGRRGDETH